MLSSMQDKIQRQTAFWRRENHDRPAIGFTGGYFATDALRMLDRTEGYLRPSDINVARVLEDCDRESAAWAGCMGDLFWTARPLLGFRWLPAVLGAPIFVGGDSIWAEAFLKDYGQLDRFSFSEDNEWVQCLWALSDAMVKNAGGRYPVATDEFLAPLTALAEIRGNTEMALDVYDRPAELERGLMILTELWGALTQAHYKRLPAWHGGYSSGQRHVWAPGRIGEFNEDPVFMFSLRHHKRFIIPAHRRLVQFIEYPYIHLHSTQMHSLDHLLDMDDLPAIEYTPDYGSVIAELIPTMIKIQKRKPLIVHAYLSEAEMRMIIEQVPPEGLWVISRTAGPEEARRLQDAILG
jgi:hypothetical protein